MALKLRRRSVAEATREPRPSLLPARAAIRVGIRPNRDISGKKEAGRGYLLSAGRTYYLSEAHAVWLEGNGYADFIETPRAARGSFLSLARLYEKPPKGLPPWEIEVSRALLSPSNPH